MATAICSTGVPRPCHFGQPVRACFAGHLLRVCDASVEDQDTIWTVGRPVFAADELPGDPGVFEVLGAR